jgi:hypothetical protein
MKTRAQQGFWPTRRQLAASSLELACWLTAAGLALALFLASAPNPRPALPAIAATTSAPAPHWTLYQQHCIERITARAGQKTEEYVANEINQLCIAPFRGMPAAPAGVTPGSCGPRLTMRLAAARRPVAGCLSG